jgi:Nucleotidyltransferase of unknown function (DUF6036)
MQDSLKSRIGLPQPPSDLWSLVRGTPTVDPDDLFHAIEVEACRPSPDFRTRLLLRDSFRALQKRWGSDVALSRLSPSAAMAIQPILRENLGDSGFPTLEGRLMQRTDPETMLQFLRELGTAVAHETRIEIGGSGALILTGLLRRGTEDLDAVDEVPAALRAQHDLLNSLAARYGLRLTHFQSHYLPAGWKHRLVSLGRFGKLDVFLVDVLDIFLGKLFSAREKDLDDLRQLAPALDRPTIDGRLRSTCASLLAESLLKANAERNWYIVFGDSLAI